MVCYLLSNYQDSSKSYSLTIYLYAFSLYRPMYLSDEYIYIYIYIYVNFNTYTEGTDVPIFYI